MAEDVLTGERQNVGLWLVQASVAHTLGGEVTWHNDDGAVTEIQFPVRFEHIRQPGQIHGRQQQGCT